MILEAVIFDFDGVIVDSYDLHRTAWMEAFDALFARPFPELPPEQLTGKSSLAIATAICVAAGVSEVERLFQHKTDRIVNGETFAALLPGATELVSALHQMNIPMAIASNAPSAYITRTVQRYDLPITTIFGFEQVTQPKPAPDLYIQAAKQLKVSPSGCVVFEDSPPGLTAAVAANMTAIGIRARSSDKSMIAAGAQQLFNSLEDVLNSPFFETILP